MFRKNTSEQQHSDDENQSQDQRFLDLEKGSNENEVPYQPLTDSKEHASPSSQIIVLNTLLESKHSGLTTISLNDQSEQELQGILSELDTAISLLAFRCTPGLSISSCTLLSTFSAWLAMTLATDRHDDALFAAEAAGIGMVSILLLAAAISLKIDPLPGCAFLLLMFPLQFAIIDYYNDTPSNLVLAESAGVVGGISLVSLFFTIRHYFNNTWTIQQELPEDKMQTVQAVIRSTNTTVHDDKPIISSLKSKRAEVTKAIQQKGLLENSMFQGLPVMVRPENRNESGQVNIQAKL